VESQTHFPITQATV